MHHIFSHSLKKPSKSRCGDASFAGDILIQKEKYILLIVADGVSSRPKDWLASQTTINTIVQELKQTEQSIVLALQKAVLSANQELCQGVDDTMGMYSTLSLALYSENQKKIWIVNVGDSRIYGFQNGKFIQLTKDDSKSQVVNVNSNINYFDGSPLMKSYLTKAIGQANLKIEVQEMSTDDYDAFILVSDGFYSLFSFEDHARKLIQEGDIKKTTSMLQEQLLSEITDDASFAILRLTNLKSINLKEIIKKNNNDISVAMILSVLDKTLIHAIEAEDFEYQEALLNFMEKKSAFYDKPKMIEILEIMIAAKSRHVQKMVLMIRKL